MSTVNIAIVGKMYAGKTTLANSLVKHGYTRVMMAGPLKAIAGLAYGGEIVKGNEYETSYGPKSGRQILQEVGQSMKTVDRDFWINCFFNDVENLRSIGHEAFTVDDVRFIFEAEALREYGWAIVKVETPEEERLARGREALGRDITPQELAHESEREVDAIQSDYIWSGVTDIAKYDDLSGGLIDVVTELVNWRRQ